MNFASQLIVISDISSYGEKRGSRNHNQDVQEADRYSRELIVWIGIMHIDRILVTMFESKAHDDSVVE